MGLSQRQEGKHAVAAKTWEPLLAKVDPNTAATLRTQINEARAEAGLPPLADAAPAADASPALLTVTGADAPDIPAHASNLGQPSTRFPLTAPWCREGPPREHPLTTLVTSL